MNYDELDRAIRGARREIFRLEVQQSYAGVLDPGWDEWQASGRLPAPTPEAQDWYDGIASRTASGVLHHRVLVVDEPLNHYLHYEFAAFEQGCIAAGEQIHVVRRAEHRDLATLSEDFWMVDEEIVAIMNYDAEHRPLGPSAPDRPTSVYVAQRDLALGHATPLAQWMTENRALLAG